MVQKIVDLFVCYDRIHERDGRTGGQTDGRTDGVGRTYAWRRVTKIQSVYVKMQVPSIENLLSSIHAIGEEFFTF